MLVICVRFHMLAIISHWSNGRMDKANVRAQLDRCLATVEGQVLFPNAIVENSTSKTSDRQDILGR